MHRILGTNRRKKMDIGQICVKIAGRDAGLKCVIVDKLDEKIVLIDGQTRRRKCNITHLEPSGEILEVKKGASHEDVSAAFEKIGLLARSSKPKEAKPRPRKKRKTPEELALQKKAKKVVKKETAAKPEEKTAEKAEPKKV